MTRPTANPTEAPEPTTNGKETSPGKSANGTPRSLPSRLPKPAGWSRRTQVLAGVGVLVLLVTVGVAYSYWYYGAHRARTDLVTHKVRYERLELTIVERGALESAKNSDVYCTVKAGQKGSTNASIIKWLIDDGSSVKKGDLLVDLDDSGFQDQLKTQKITVDNADANRVKATEDYNIQVSQNESDIKTAETQLEIARIDLTKYKEGDYPQQLKIFEGNIKQAESDVEQQRDRVAWANRMVKKGYLTVTQAQGEQSKLESLQINLAKALEDRRVLTDPTFGTGKRQVTFLENDVREKERALERVKSQAKAKEVQAKIVRETTKSVYDQEFTKYKEIEGEIKKCKIYAPQDGMVVYYIPEQVRGGGGSQQAVIAQGEPVREGQKLMQIPDLRAMQVNTKVHEAMVSRVHSGEKALVRVDSFPDRVLSASVATVATVSSQQDFVSSDVKVYTTKVMIDESLDGLKPGMSAEVTISVGDALEHVLTVPVQAIVGGAELGKYRKCFVLTPQGPEERNVVVGQSNEKMAEIKEGLREGEEVVLNPSALVNDKTRTRQPGERKGAVKSGDEPKDAPAAKTPAAPEKKGPASKEGSEPKGKMSPEERQKQIDKFRNASPAERKKMLEQVPEAYREKMKERLKAAGIEVE